MQQVKQNKDFKISLIFTIIGIFASVCIAYYQISMFSESTKEIIIAQLGSVQALIPIAALQGALFTFIAAFAGLKTARKVNLNLNFTYNKSAFVTAILIGMATAFIITGSDRFIFAPYLPNTTGTYVFSPIYFVSGILYGGIIEEILLRLFTMSLLVLLLWKIFAKEKDRLHIPDRIYITAILLASILFATGHLPFTAQSIGLSAPVVARCFILNGIGGIGFGCLYWKKGLAYSMVAHAATHIFMQAVFMPVLF